MGGAPFFGGPVESSGMWGWKGHDRPMLIAQITDIHLGFEPGNAEEKNRRRLDAVLDALIEGPNRPDLLLATGDLTENGDPESYRQLAGALARCPFPVWPMVGNHDLRAPFLEAFPGAPTADGFVQHAMVQGGLHIILLDTLEEGRHGGGFCAGRAAWLRERLAERAEMPTLIALHHPPSPTGIGWMDMGGQEPWVARLGDVLADAPQVRALLCGHVHRAIASPWRGMTVCVCPSTAPQVALDLSPIAPGAPDARAMIVAEGPGYALHWWNGGDLASHFQTVQDAPVLARFDDAMRPLVDQMMAERR